MRFDGKVRIVAVRRIAFLKPFPAAFNLIKALSALLIGQNVFFEILLDLMELQEKELVFIAGLPETDFEFLDFLGVPTAGFDYLFLLLSCTLEFFCPGFQTAYALLQPVFVLFQDTVFLGKFLLV
jgi:hypothetical protein